MSDIVQLYDASNNAVYPVTHLRAVRDSSGTTLESMMQDVREIAVGYYECSTPGSTAAKTITIDSSVFLSTKILCKVKFVEKNTAANATLNINQTGAKPLYYNGVRVSTNNSWYAGEVATLFYDGSAFQLNSLPDLNEYDVSAKNPTGGPNSDGKFTLAYILSNANTLIPTSLRKGGMSIKFVSSSDNKYVQYRYMGTATIGTPNPFLDEANWQGVDEYPTSESKNLVESGGAAYDILTRANCYFAYGLFNGSCIWSAINTNNIHLVIDVSELNPSVLRYYTSVSGRLAFCKSYKKPVLNESLDYVVEGGSFVGLSSGANVVSIPEGTKIIILQTKQSGNDAMPEHLYINGFDFTQSVKKNMSVRFANDDELNANNLLATLVYGGEIPLINGKYLSKNGISINNKESSYITDYIKVDSSIDYYYTGRFGGAAAGAHFFSDFNTLLSSWITNDIAQHTNEKVVFPDGTKYVRFSSYQGSLIVTAKSKIQENIDESIDIINEELSDLDMLQKISDNILINKGKFGGTPLIWTGLNDDNKHIVIDVSAFNGDDIIYKYTKVSGARMAFLESYNTPELNAELDVVDGTALVGINTGVHSVSIPEGTKYVVLQTLFNGADVLPDSFCINAIDYSIPFKDAVAKIGMECNNQSAEIDSLNIVNGLEIKKNKGWYLRASGFGEGLEADSYVSDYIKIDNNIRYYYTGRFGGACAAAHFFSDIDVFISAWTDSTLSPRTDVPVPVPSNAKYVRFSSFQRDFSISSTKHFLSIDNFDINPIFNELTIDKDVDFVNGIFDILVFKVRYNSITNVYTNGVMVRYKLNSATVWEYYLTKDYGTQEEAEDNLEALATYTFATASPRTPISYSINWDKVTSNGITRFENIKLNPNFVKRLPKFDSPISLGTRDIKSILWLGTSIPRGGYPEMVGAILGCKVYNEAEGESLCRLGWGAGCIKEGDTIDIWGCDINTHAANPASNTITALAKSLSASKAEKQYLLNNLAHFEEVTQTTLDRTRYTDDVIMSFSYEDKILKYVDSSRNDYTPIDLIVFDHGHNDIVPDGVPAWDTYSLTNTNKDNYWGAMNFLLDVIKKYQPNIAICQVSHYYGWENYTGSGDEKIWDAQKQIADYNGMVFCPLYKLTGYSSRRMLRTNGYWSQDGIWHNSGFSYLINQDGTISTNSYTIAKLYNLDGTWSNQIFTSNGQNIPSIVSSREIGQKTGELEVNYNISTREAAFPDRLHPYSDTSTKALKKIATLLAGWLKGTYCM